MENPGDQFLGNRKIVLWQPNPPDNLVGGLVALETQLTIEKDKEKEGAYTLRWRDKDKGSCTLASLTFNGRELSADSPVVKVDGAGGTVTDIPLRGATVKPGVIVTLTGRGAFQEGNPGTFAAEANPRGGSEEREAHRRSPGWRHWLRRLLHRLDKLLAEA